MCGKTATQAFAVDWYINATAMQQQMLSAYVKEAHPDLYEQYIKTFQAGKWVGMKVENAEGCIFLSEAIVWKLQVEVHRDVLDTGICVCMATGSFIGGRVIFPDLDLVLNYVPLCC
jgi:drug/metabolite transporter superfamily protein YnfA